MKQLIIISTLLLFVATAGTGQKMKDRIEAQKVAFFTNKLDLTAKESEKFWPIYKEHQRKVMELKRAGRKQGRKARDFSKLSDKEIESMIENRFKIKEQEIELERALIKKLKKFMPLQKIIQIPRVENQFRKWLLKQRKNIMNKRRMRGQ